MSGIKRIVAERERQIETECWTSEHDDEHTDRSLAMAAACYASPIPIFRANKHAVGTDYCDPWPWAGQYDKRDRHDEIRRLEIAGALIAAEIDRLERKNSEPQP